MVDGGGGGQLLFQWSSRFPVIDLSTCSPEWQLYYTQVAVPLWRSSDNMIELLQKKNKAHFGRRLSAIVSTAILQQKKKENTANKLAHREGRTRSLQIALIT